MYNESTNTYFDIVIGGEALNIKAENILYFEMVETAGIELPLMQLQFMTRDEKVRDRVIENNIVQVKIGTDPNNVDTFDISLFGKDKQVSGIGTYHCYIVGFLKDKKFLLDKIQHVQPTNSLDGIKNICDMFKMNLVTDITQVKDNPQNWLACNESFRHLVVDMWSHMDIRPSFPLAAITRYGDFLLRDAKPLWNLVQGEKAQNYNDLNFINAFKAENDIEVYNLYAGYGKLVNLYNNITGEQDVYVQDTERILAATKANEISKAGNKTLEGFQKSGNVHDSFYESYFYNVSKLIQLSNIWGYVDLIGKYEKSLSLLDFVNLRLADIEEDSPYTGKYIVNTLVYSLTSNSPFTTRVYISRDSNNNIENSIIEEDTGITITSTTKEKILKDLKFAKSLLSILRQYLDGSLVSDTMNYLTNLKYQLLNSFSIGGQSISLSSQTDAINSVKNLGSNIFSKLLDKAIPYNIQYLFQTQDWGRNLDLLTLLNTTIQLYTPSEFADFYEELLLTIDAINNS